MGKIVLLDDLTINQIAAGEVIERPASVVKELVENSIDAGSTKITVEVRNGGIKQIKIIDNGCGMTSDDIEYAFERHATSKIRKAEDLENVKSMGFRGEALASIAAIANVEIVSKTEQDEFGHKLVIEGGNILEREEVGSQKGTTIIVNNLFYNTPVRYKFLKKDYTELGYIEDAIYRIAIANPNISIKLIADGKNIVQTAGNGEIKTVIYAIYGKEVVDGLIDVEYSINDITVTGVIGKPEIARGNRSYQMFFVNKRFIKDKTLSAAVEQAYKGFLPIGKFPFLMLNIDIPPHTIDVNVHPTKLEIRFQEEQKVFQIVYHAIKEGLLKGDLIRDTEKQTEENIILEKQNMEKIEQESPKKNGESAINGFLGFFRKKEEEPEKTEINDAADKNNAIEQIYIKQNKLDANSIEARESKIEIPEPEEKFDFKEMYAKTFGTKIEEEPSGYVPEQSEKAENISIFEDAETEKYVPNYKYCGTAFSTYIILEINDEIYILDQHAAHERIMYEKVKANFYSSGERDSQIMLLPDIINLTHKEKDIVRENVELLEKAGFIFEDFGDNTLRLIGVPSICFDLDTKKLFIQLLDEIGTVAITATQEKEEKFIATIACKAAVKANMKLTEEEVHSLLEKLMKLPNPFTCPHGRPTAIKMTKYEIERKFNRK